MYVTQSGSSDPSSGFGIRRHSLPRMMAVHGALKLKLKDPPATKGKRKGRSFAVSGSRCQVRGVRFAVSGSRCQVRGVRFAVSGSRCQVRGVRFAVFPRSARP